MLHHPRLAQRRKLLTTSLEQIRASDVTWVLCANGEEVVASTSCLFRHRDAPKAAGTRSLAVKHLIVYRDVRQRRLAEALVLEDDAIVPSDLWVSLAAPWSTRPLDAAIFWLGGVIRGGGHFGRTNTTHTPSSFCGQRSMRTVVEGAAAAVHGDMARSAPTNRPSANATNVTTQRATSRVVACRPEVHCVHRRNLGSIPAFIGAVGYIITSRGALAMANIGVLAPADKASTPCWLVIGMHVP